MMFKRAGDLVNDEEKMEEIGFKRAGDLVNDEEKIEEIGFKRAGDLVNDEENVDISKMTFEEVKQYVLEHTAKVRNHYDLVAEAGSIIVPFEEFVKMINDGYEIYKSEVLNENLISIEFQKEMKRNKSR